MNEDEMKVAVRLGLAPPYRLVYQGGHHNVFCDGERHAWTNGGYTRFAPMDRIGCVGRCDCARYTKGNHE